ncbi:MAG TPA: hypothetical protein VJZ77_19160 [Blastocatellia bacterium]|nr:hypothetical protein [Blastocatellia bacterium]
MSRKILLQIVVQLLAVGIFCADVYPCSCEFWSARKKLKKAQAVFVGEVIGITCQDASCPDNKITFKVEKHWKGVIEQRVTVLSAPPVCCTCGLKVNVGDKVLVYAYKTDNGDLETSLCSSIRIGNESADKQLKELGESKSLKSN